MAEENEATACIICLHTLEPDTMVRICFGCFGYSVCISCTEEICRSNTKKCPMCRSHWFCRDYNMTYADAIHWSTEVKPFAISRRRSLSIAERNRRHLAGLLENIGIIPMGS
jgi:hypothetical protein